MAAIKLIVLFDLNKIEAIAQPKSRPPSEKQWMAVTLSTYLTIKDGGGCGGDCFTNIVHKENPIDAIYTNIQRQDRMVARHREREGGRSNV